MLKIKQWLLSKEPQFEILNETSAGDMSARRISDDKIFHRFQMQPGPDKHTMYDIMSFLRDNSKKSRFGRMVEIRIYDRVTRNFLKSRILPINDL